MFMPRPTKHLSLEQKLQLLLDERDIRDIIYRECRAKSRADIELMRTCYFEDAVIHLAPFADGIRARDFIGEGMVAGAMATGEMVLYHASQILIDIDGDVARTETYIDSAKILHERADDGDKIMRLSGARHLNRFERRNEEWRIAEFWQIHEWGFFEQTPPLKKAMSIYGIGTETGKLVANPAMQRTMLSPITPKRDREDLSYNI